MAQRLIQQLASMVVEDIGVIAFIIATIAILRVATTTVTTATIGVAAAVCKIVAFATILIPPNLLKEIQHRNLAQLQIQHRRSFQVKSFIVVTTYFVATIGLLIIVIMLIIITIIIITADYP